MRKEWKMRGSVKGNSSAVQYSRDAMRRRVRGISIGNACQFSKSKSYQYIRDRHRNTTKELFLIYQCVEWEAMIGNRVCFFISAIEYSDSPNKRDHF